MIPPSAAEEVILPIINEKKLCEMNFLNVRLLQLPETQKLPLPPFFRKCMCP